MVIATAGEKVTAAAGEKVTVAATVKVSGVLKVTVTGVLERETYVEKGRVIYVGEGMVTSDVLESEPYASGEMVIYDVNVMKIAFRDEIYVLETWIPGLNVSWE